jgi:pimeloyl-ACP methyl ester carboxylesterase
MSTASKSAGYLVEEIGSFHIGGRQAVVSGLPPREVVLTAGAPPRNVDPNGELEVEQMYVQYVRLARPKAKVPLLMWHGGGLTGVTWETKPDGRPGWQQRFLELGYTVYVSDAVERGRASWARYPEVFATEPLFRSKKEAWELFRMGPRYETGGRREAYAGQRFPIGAFDQFAKQAVPRWVTNDAATQRAYDALVAKVGPSIVMVHSQGGNFGFNAAINAPDKVRALIAIEPSGAPDPSQVDVARLRGVPHLIVWGDYLDRSPAWPPLAAASRRYRDALRAAGVEADTIDLPAMGIAGNSHMLMMDTNSDEIAGLIHAWIARHGLVDG